jgi:NTP pyrophosphatase (non-canonical NTP hydrolase)
MKPANVNDTILRIFAVARRDAKPILAMMAKVFEEGGELAQAVNITEGHLKHKTLPEPLVGEVADVVQCAIAVLQKATPDLTDVARLQLLAEWLEKKTDKWETVIAPKKPDFKAIIKSVPKSKPTNRPKISVLIRKHPAGVPQPTGERVIFKMEPVKGTTLIQVGLGPNGKQGWQLDLEKATPSFLTFRRVGNEHGKQPLTLQEAYALWKS